MTRDTRNSHITENPSPSEFSFLSDLPSHIIFTGIHHQYYKDENGTHVFGWAIDVRHVWGLHQPLVSTTGRGRTIAEAYENTLTRFGEAMERAKRDAAEADARLAEQRARDAEASAKLDAALDAMLAKL
jgi:hypothetical protein